MLRTRGFDRFCRNARREISLRRSITFTRAALLLCLATLCLVNRPQIARAESNLLFNGDLTDGVANRPDHWQAEGWLTGPDITVYSWHHDANGPDLEVSNLKGNDARWVQNVHLGPGWYHFTALIRADDVGPSNTGAALSVMEDGIISQQLHGTTNWRRVGFFLKVGQSGADVGVACRLGGYGSLNTGTAFCRELRAELEVPASSEDPRYDLDAIRGSNAPPQNPDSSALVISILVLCAAILIGVVGWRRFAKGGSGRGGGAGPTLAAPSAVPAQSTSPRPPDHVQRRVEAILFLVAALTFLYFYQASDHSTASRIDLIRALLERHTLWIENPYAGYNTADIVQLNSHIYSNKAPGGALTGIIPWAATATILRIFVKPDTGLYWALATYVTTVLTVSFLVAFLLVLLYRSALFLGAANGPAVAVALTLGFGTIMFPYATEFTAEPIAAAFIFFAFYLLMTTGRQSHLTGKYFCAGFFSGWAVLCDYPTFLLAAGVSVYALWKQPRGNPILAFVAGSFIPAILLATYNEAAFGNPLFLSYEAYMLPGSDRFPEQAVGFAGVTYPRADILWNILFGAQRGLLFCNPVLLLVVPGLVLFWRQERYRSESLLVTYVVLSFVLFNASYGESIIYWGGGTATGPRHIVSALPFMVLTLSFLPKQLDYAFVPLALLSVVLMVMVTAVEPHLPYEYDNPFRDFIWPAYLRGDLAYNKNAYFGGQPIVGDSVAFNLGKLAGLPGALQLLPLGLIWLICACALLNALKPWRDAASRRRMLAAVGLAIGAVFAPPTVGSILAKPDLKMAHGLLGRYYEGLRPNGYPAHIVRVDQTIDFDSVVQLGALPTPSSVIWTGNIAISMPGMYRFAIIADDNGWLKIDGHWVIGNAGEVTKPRDVGSIQLASGLHSIEVGEHNIWDGAQMKLLWQLPAGREELVPSSVLIPESASSSSH
jgi:hypothetical protein